VQTAAVRSQMELMVSPRLRATTPKAEAPRTATADQRRKAAIRLDVIRFLPRRHLLD
jgi:hypothetical protein